MDELSKILDLNEKVNWEGKPVFAPYMAGPLIGLVFALVVFVPFLLLFFLPFFIFSAGGMPFGAGGGVFDIIFGLILFAIVCLPFLAMPAVPIYMYLNYKNIHYAITTKRVIIQAGLIGRDFKSLDFDQITNAQVNVGI